MDEGLMATIIDSRDKGHYPISIGTSLAIEGALGITHDEEGKVKDKLSQLPYMQYDEIWFNLRTLFRNANGAIQKNDEIRMTPQNYAVILAEEMMIIRAIFERHTHGRFKPYFYVCDYNSLSKQFKHATFKEVKTPKQKEYAAMENMAIELLAKRLEGTVETYYHFDTEIKGHGKSALMLTQYPLDLLSNDNFKEIALIESHTGVVKTRAQWYTKLNGGKDLPRIPFDKMTIQLFGDSGGLFAPQPTEFRKRLCEIAEQYKWNPMTTEERIKLTVKLSRAPTLEGAIMKMYSSVL